MRKFIEWLRGSTYLLIAFLIWAVWSIGPLLSNKPVEFQAAGSIVVAWAIFFYGRDRFLRDKVIDKANSDLSKVAYNCLNARLEFHRSLAENTQNMNTLAYARILKKLGFTDAEMGDTVRAIEGLKIALNDTEHHENLYHNLKQAETELSKFIEYADTVIPVQNDWNKWVYWAELVLVIFGTLQWGYGDKWVTAIHSAYLVPEYWKSVIPF